LQRKAEKPGKGLGKTTGWIHRAELKALGVKMQGGVNYERITDEGLVISEGPARKNIRTIPADSIVLCTGQLPERSLAGKLQDIGKKTHIIGGADVAAELDAKRAINQGCRLAASF
ncbi:MAG: NADPH-dependent 2,4-dienoyl-CoA reductase, partial [Pseudomonadota bacterium]